MKKRRLRPLAADLPSFLQQSAAPTEYQPPTPPPIERALLTVVKRAWRAPFTLACDFARKHVAHVAMAACMGLITTRIEAGSYGRTWHVSTAGLRMLNEVETE